MIIDIIDAIIITLSPAIDTPLFSPHYCRHYYYIDIDY
jgi:hypothetical protein